MPIGNVLTRRIRILRFRRSIGRAVRNLDSAAERPGLGSMLDELCLWAIGMPWVVESPFGARETLRLFMLDCEPLSCREPWFAIHEVDGLGGQGPGVLVILQDALVGRIMAISGSAGIEPIGRGRSITAIGFPTTEEEFQALLELLGITYAAVFESSN
jgi:hypothetical protein